jgi:RNA polymerase sigma-70 factor (ECF subfamily)
MAQGPQEGASEAGDFSARLEHYRGWIVALARLQVGDGFRGKFDPSDAAQQTLLEAVRAGPGFRGTTEGELLAWLRQILAHVLAHEFRRYKGAKARDVAREVSLEQALERSSLRLGAVLAAGWSSPSHHAARVEEGVRLAAVLSRLSADDREVILLRNVEGLPHDEVARRMGRSPGAVRMLWARALARLRTEVEKEGFAR